MENNNTSSVSDTPIIIHTDSFDLQLDQKQAEKLYRDLGKKLANGKLKQLIEKHALIEHKGIFIPARFRQFAKKTSIKTGKPPHNYNYFKDNHGSYGFLINNGNINSFSELGDPLDRTSSIGKVFQGVLKLESFTRTQLVKNRLITNNQRVKAIIDILLIEEYIEKIPSSNNKSVSYRVIKKELEH